MEALNARWRSLRHRARRYWPLAEMTLSLPGATHPYRIAQPAFPEDLLDELIARPARAKPARPMRTLHTGGSPVLRAAAVEARNNVNTGERMPYWGLLWPSGLALAEEVLRGASTGEEAPRYWSVQARQAGARGAPLQDTESTASASPLSPQGGARGAASDHREAERAQSEAVGLGVRIPRALELGCGLGVTATAALNAGLALTAVDCFPEALAFCRYNTLRNMGRTPVTWLVDWRTETGRAALALGAPYDLLLAADVLYEEPDVALLLELAPRLVGAGGRFWLAEPGRRASEKFVAEALARGWQDTLTVNERLWPPDGERARVTIHRFVVA